MIFNEFVAKTCQSNVKEAILSLKSKPYTIDNDQFSFDEDYPLHQLAYTNDWKHVIEFYKIKDGNIDIDKQDKIGNTPLIIAAVRGLREVVEVLSFLNADCSIVNQEGWSPLHESISYGDSNIVRILLQLSNVQNIRRFMEVYARTKTESVNTQDFVIDFEYNVKTWVPLLSRFLPHDRCKLTKCGRKIRFDCTLMDFKNQSWVRGNLSCVINGDISNSSYYDVYVINHDSRCYEKLGLGDPLKISDKVLCDLMTQDITYPTIDVKSTDFVQKTRLWPFTGVLKEKIGNYETTMYDLNNVKMIIKKRREHMSKEQITLNKSYFQNIITGNFTINQKSLENGAICPAISENSDISWKTYKENMQSNKFIIFGRTPVCKTSVKNFNINIGMCDEFPLSISEVLDTIELFLPMKYVCRLREIMSTKLPPGFPLYIDIPVFPTITANISFLSAQVGSPNLNLDDNLFVIPNDFKKIVREME